MPTHTERDTHAQEIFTRIRKQTSIAERFTLAELPVNKAYVRVNNGGGHACKHASNQSKRSKQDEPIKGSVVHFTLLCPRAFSAEDVRMITVVIIGEGIIKKIHDMLPTLLQQRSWQDRHTHREREGGARVPV